MGVAESCLKRFTKQLESEEDQAMKQFKEINKQKNEDIFKTINSIKKLKNGYSNNSRYKSSKKQQQKKFFCERFFQQRNQESIIAQLFITNNDKNQHVEQAKMVIKQNKNKSNQISNNIKIFPNPIDNLINTKNGIKQSQRYFINKRGIQNLGNTCYINSALQAIKHFDYLDSSFLDQQDSNLAQLLKKFFTKLENGQNYLKELQYFVRISKSMQNHELGGGDSYTTLFNYFSYITNEIEKQQQIQNLNDKDQSLLSFQESFTVIFSDGLQCQNCLKYLKDDFQDICYFEEKDSSIDVQCLDDILQQPSVYGEQYQNLSCNNCNQFSCFKTKRSILAFPKFLIIKLPEFSNILISDEFLKLEFCKNQKYKLEGYCNYSGAHYTYCRNYDDQWIEFSDSFVTPTNLSLQIAIYLIYHRIQAQ